MNEDLKARLARLEAKDDSPPSSSIQPKTSPKAARRSGASGRGGSSMTKMILLGVACLIVLPVGATVATLYLPQINGAANKAMRLVEPSKEITEDRSVERQADSRDPDEGVFRKSNGTISAQEDTYGKSAEGNARRLTLEMEAAQVNRAKLLNASERLYGVD